MWLVVEREGNELVSGLGRRAGLGSKLDVSVILRASIGALTDPSVDLSDHIRVRSTGNGNTNDDLCEDYQSDLHIL